LRGSRLLLQSQFNAEALHLQFEMPDHLEDLCSLRLA
jgi:hypothetical protein